MSLQANLLVLLLGTLQGALMSFWFLKNRSRQRSHLYMGLFLAVIGLQLTLKILSKAWLTQQVFPWYVVSYQLPYLVGPLLYFYWITHNGRPVKAIQLFHFLPFLLASFVDWTFLYWLRLIDLHPVLRALLQSMSIVIYAIIIVRSGKADHKKVNSFIVTSFAAELLVILAMALMQEYYGVIPDIRWMFAVLTVLIYWATYQLINSRKIEDSKSENEHEVRYARSGLINETVNRIENALHEAMHSDSLFLDSSLTLDRLAEKLNFPRHHLSQVINEWLGKTFTEYLTELRLRHVISCFENPKMNHLTIAAIAFDLGFNSISTFNEVFKKYHVHTPSAYRKLAQRVIQKIE